MTKQWLMPIALLLSPLPARADAMPRAKVGDAWEIVRTQESAETQAGGVSSGTSFDRDTLAARVIAVRDDGVEWEYDLPNGATADDRARDWHLPARIFKPTHGTAQLANQAELEARIDPWLKSANLSRAVCGHWYFTWNAFRVDCDPQSVLKSVAAFDLGPDNLDDGAPYHERDALGSAPLRQSAVRADGATFVVVLAIDPEKVRHDEAEADRVIGEIVRKPVTPEAATRAHADEQISGTMTITFETDAVGVVRKTNIMRLELRKPDGTVTTRVTTIKLERRQGVVRRRPGEGGSAMSIRRASGAAPSRWADRRASSIARLH